MAKKCNTDFFNNKNNFLFYQEIKSILIKDNTGNKRCKYCIGIPTYNRIETLKETIDSCLNQQRIDDYVILICDNNPQRDDETENFIKQLTSDKIKYYKHEENIGMYGNINRIFELSECEYTICIHDDDLLYPSFLNVVDQIVNKNEDIDILYTSGDFWNSDSSPAPTEKISGRCYIYKNSSLDCAITNPHPPTGIVVKTQSFLNFGGFDLEPYPSNDYYFNVNAFDRLNTYTVNQSLFVYRWGVNTTLKLDTILSFIKVDLPLKKYIIETHPYLKLFTKSILIIYSDYKIKTLRHFYPSFDINQLNMLVLKPTSFERISARIFKFVLNYVLILKHKVYSRRVILSL